MDWEPPFDSAFFFLYRGDFDPSMTSELIFVGLGLSGTDGMTVKALNALRECDKIYAEFYTSMLIGTKPEDLEAVIGKKIKVLYRAQVEECDDIIRAAMAMRNVV